MINLYTVATAPMFPYAKVFFGSLFTYTDLSPIHKILVLDAGLHEVQRKWLKDRYAKIEFIRHKKQLIARRHKDGAWGETVSLKTKNLHNSFALDHSLPYLMLDLDSYFVKDFYEHLDLEKDFEVGLCRRIRPAKIGGTGPVELGGGCPYIGSFFVANNKKPDKTITFMEKWMDIMALGGRLKETPSLCRLINGYRLGWQGEKDFKPSPLKGFKIKEYPEQLFSCYKGFNSETKILHFKSFGGRNPFDMPLAYTKRFSRVRGFDKADALKFLGEGYLDKHCASPDFSVV